MKVNHHNAKYIVTFNNAIENYEVGDCKETTIDFIGDDIDQLAAEVVADDPNYPLIFKKVVDECCVVGLFIAEGDTSPTAIMYEQ